MPVKIKCPACAALMSVADASVGKKVRCAKCQEVFLAKGPAPKPPVDDEDDAPAPPPKTGVKTSPGKPNGKPAPPPPKAAGKKSPLAPRDDDDEDDDKPTPPKKKKGSPVFMILGIVGGVFLLLCMGCGGGIFYIYWQVSSGIQQAQNEFKKFEEELNNGDPNNPFNDPNSPFKNGDPFKTAPKINDFNGALEAVKSADKAQQGAGADWLAKAPLDQAKQAEVARALDALVAGTDLNTRYKAVKALDVWADKNSVPALVKAMEEDKEGWGHDTLKKEGFSIMVRLKDPRGAWGVVRYLEKPIGDEPAKKALIDMGPVAEPAVVPYFNIPHNGARERARAVLQTYGTKFDVLVKQCLKDALDKDQNRRQSALQFLVEFKQPVPESGTEPARVLEGVLLTSQDAQARELACRALGVWGDKNSVTVLLKQVDDATPGQAGDNLRRHAIEALGKLRDPRAAPVLFAKLAQPNLRDAADRALIALGPAAEAELMKHLEDENKTLAADAARLLKMMGSKTNPDLSRALGDLKSPDAQRRREGANYISQQRVPDKEKQAEVAKALEVCLDDQDQAVRDLAARALVVWATPENTPALIKSLNNENDRIRQPAIETVGRLKVEAAIAPLCQLLVLSPKDRNLIVKALQDIGPKSELEAVKYLGHQDKNVRLEVCKVLQAVGTKASLGPLAAAGQAAQAAKQNDVAMAVARAAAAIQSR